MLNKNFSDIFLYLFIFSVMGWICEVIYCSIPAKKFINRGFLKGPYCPIYGFGAIFVILISTPFIKYPILVFILNVIVTSILEYFTSWIMEALFQIRWWDYSQFKFNLNGRICLLNSVLFGFLGLFAVYFAYPFVNNIIQYLPKDIERVLTSMLLFIYMLDTLTTLDNLLKFSDKIKTLHNYLEEIERTNKEYNWLDKKDLTASIIRLKELCKKNPQNEKLPIILNKLENYVEKNEWSFRHLKSFPKLKFKGDDILDELKIEWNEKKEQFEEKKLKIKDGFFKKDKNNNVVNKTKNTKETITSEISFYNIFWIFVSASVLGYVVETIFCLATRGVIESRQGLLYGPFSQIYGLGAVLMTIFLTPLAKKNDRWLFFGSAILGGAFEYISSLLQEKIFGTISWEYESQKFSIGGRTSLTYMFFWGILGVFFVKEIYPRLLKLIKKIPNRQKNFFTMLFLILLTVDIFLSGAAVHRWSNRNAGIASNNSFEQFLDKKYPDEMLKEIYPNMTLLKKIE